ncbi:MAG: hypothetical protein QOF09_821 [Alphaproteobacteria bacterium]|jgi:hypothetical protein|nr:hypothetical protein [Alphaproteobacteria bacterium]
MATKEIDRSAQIYVRVAGILMAILLVFGGLHTFGVLR